MSSSSRRWSLRSLAGGGVALVALAVVSCQGPEDGKAPHQPIRGVDTPREQSSQLEPTDLRGSHPGALGLRTLSPRTPSMEKHS